MPPARLLEKLNKIAGKNAIGRVDLVENRFLGIKSRGVYETPGGTLLLAAHRAMESVSLDKKTMHDKEEVMPEYAKLIYNGYWFSKKRYRLQKIIDKNKNKVSGKIKLKLFKGNIIILSRVATNKAYSLKKCPLKKTDLSTKIVLKGLLNFIKQSFINSFNIN